MKKLIIILSQITGILEKIKSFPVLSLLLKRMTISFGILVSTLIASFGQTQTFTTSQTYTVPAGVTRIIVECWGAGGGGSSRSTNGTYQGGGGGGGAYARSIINVTPASGHPVVVGTGGAASSAGGNSTFDATVVVAAGGNGGTNNSTVAGTGGSVASSTGDMIYSGGDGADGGVTAGYSGGGGGGAGSNGTGGSASGSTAGTGTANNGGNGATGVNGSTNGNNGNTYGGGGSGASTNSNTNRTGGSGANGYVVVTALTVYYSYGNTTPTNVNNWWTNTNGTGTHPANFTANNQVFVIQNGSNYATTATWAVSGTNTMVEIQNGGTLTENNNITLSANTTLLIDNGGILNHNVNATAIFGGTESFGNTSTVNYGYAGAQSVIAAPYGNLTISGGNTKTLAGAATVNGTLNLSSGILDIGANNLTIADGATITGSFDNTHMILTSGAGMLIKQSSTAAGFVMTYPVGTGTSYTPMQISSLTATLAGTENISIATVAANATGMPASSLKRYWNVQNSGGLTGINANVSFTYINPGDIGTGGNQVTYLPFLYTASWQAPAGASLGGANPISSIGTSVLQGTWTANSANTYYSYQSGDWTTATTWTTDPSGTLSVNPAVPGQFDNVVILNGRTVNIKSPNNNRTVSSLEIRLGGFLDLTTTSGHNFGTVTGQGVLRLSSSNFPLGTFDDFVSATGGTVEYYNLNGVSISATQLAYNNLIVSNYTAAANTVYIDNSTSPAYVLNGNFDLNNNSTGSLTFYYGKPAAYSDNLIKMTVYGNFTVSAGSNIKVNNFSTSHALPDPNSGSVIPTYATTPVHTLILYGNLTNNGTIRFTGWPSPINTNYYTQTATAFGGTNYGHVQVFFEGSSNNTITCNGVTDFFRLVEEKGTDQTFTLEVNSSNTANFALYGPNNQGRTINTGGPEGFGYGTYYKALFIHYGTLKLNNNIDIPTLTQGGEDLNIIPTAQLWINGATVSTTINTGDPYYKATTIYGKLRISSGSLTSAHSTGIVLGTLGTPELLIEGGSLSVCQFWAITGTNIVSYTQTGGTVDIRMQGQNQTTAAMFNLSNTNSVFRMSGGVINFTNNQYVAGYNGSYFYGLMNIQAQPGNYLVTGGTINFNLPSSGTVYTANSTVPFYNVNITRNASTTTGKTTIRWTTPGSSLSVLNDLSIGANTALDLGTNTVNLNIGHNFTVNALSTYSPGSNTTTFNGTSHQTFTSGGAITGELYNMTLNANADLTIVGNDTINNIFTISPGATLRDNGYTVFALGDIVNSGTHFKPASGAGSIQLMGTAAQIISGNGSGSFNNLVLNKTGGSVTLSSNMAVTGDLRLAGTPGVWSRLNIGLNALTLGASANVYDALTGTTQNFSANRMILTSGLMSDGGVSKLYSNTNAFLFPFGLYNAANTTYYYMPANIKFSLAPAIYGTVTTRPVDSRHPLAQGTNNALTCYWKTSSTGFTGIPAASVIHQYYYDFAQSNYFVQGTEANYVPAVFRNGAAWSIYNNVNKVNDATNQILYDTAYVADGEYTAGLPAAFASIPVLYSAASGSWTNPATWSATAVGGTGGAGIPGPNTIVIIGDATHNHTVTIGSIAQSAGSLYIASGSVLDIGTTIGHNFAAIPNKLVTGGGKLRIASSLYFPAGDFGDFIQAGGGTVEYYTTGAGANITVPVTSASGLSLITYNNLILSPASGSYVLLSNTDFTVFGNIDINSGGTGLNDGVRTITTASHTYTINGNLNVNSGLLEYMNGAVQTVKVLGNLTISSGAIFSVISSGTTVANVLELQGDLTCAGTLNMYNNPRYVTTNFTGTNNQTISGGGTIGFYSLNENKGTDATSILYINSAITTGFTEPFVNLLNGTFRYNTPGAINITQNNSFTIPSTACLSVQQGTVNVVTANNNNNLLLNGKLEILGGTVNVGNAANTGATNDIEYAAAGSPTIYITSGNLNVNGQIRRNLSNTNGSLTYNQSGGNVTIFGQNFNTTRALFEITNSGSSFTMSGGGVLTVRNSGGTGYGDVYIRPASYSVTGGTLQLGDGSTAAGNNFSLIASAPLWNVTVGTAARTQTATLNILPLTILNNLTINGNSIFNANGLDVSIGNTLSNGYSDATPGISNGGYQSGAGTQTTTFTGPASYITGISGNVTNFANLKIIGNTTLSTNSNINVNTVLTLSSGVFNDGSNIVSAYGNVINTAVHTSSSSSGGINMVGAAKQIINGVGGVFGNVTIKNPSGVSLTDNETINGVLTFTAGNFYIDDYLLTLGINATIGGTTDPTKMILLNGVISDQGVKKLFPSGASPVFTYPIGVNGKYTPATYTISASGSSGSITVIPVNSANPADFDASGNELAYYWSVTGAGLSSPTITQQYNYISADVTGTESSYVTGIFNKATDTWTSPGGGTINTGVHTMNFNNIATITGEYTCGYAANFSNKPILYSIATGNWSSGATWSLTSGGASCGCTPNGNPVIISSGNTVTLDVNSALAYSIDIEGVLDAGTTAFHSLGHVSGAGKLKLTSTADGMFVFPGGEYTDFMANTASTIEFAGTNTAMLPLKPGNIYKPYQNVIFSGTGLKEISAENIKVNGNLTISNGTVLSDDLFDKNIYVLGNWTDLNTTQDGFIPGTGMVTLQGTSLQQMNVGRVENFYDLTIDNANDITLRNGAKGINIIDKLYLTNGNLLTGAGTELTISNSASTGVIVGGGSNSFVDGPMIKNIISGESFTYPVGNGTRYAPVTVSNTSSAASPAFWTATFSNTDPNTINASATLASPLTSISNNEYWTIGRPTGGSANVSLNWDAASYPGITSDPVGRTNLRVAEYDGASVWSQVGQTVNAATSTVSTSTPVATNNYVFTIGLAGVTATLTSTTVANICNNGAVASIPVALTGIPNFTLTYKVTNTATSGNLTFNQTGISSSTYNIQLSGSDLASIAQAGNNTYQVQLLTVKDNTGSSGICLGSTQFTILLTNIPSISGTFTVGSGETRAFSTTSNAGDTYLWDWNGGSSGGTFNTSASNPTNITIGAAGTYQLRVQETTTSTGCKASDVKTLTVNNVPTPNITPSTANICQGSTIAYSTPTVGTHTYTWTVVGGTPATGTGNSINVTWNTTGAGSISVDENNSGTHGTDIVNVVVDPSITTGLAVSALSSSVCSGTGTTIQVALSQNNMNYQLMNGAIPVGSVVVGNGGTISLPTGNLTALTTFSVQASNNSCNADLTQQAIVTIKPVPAITDMVSTVCSGTGFTVTPVDITNGTVPSGTTYAWSVPTVTGGLTGGAASVGSPTSIFGTLTNPTTSAQTATYTVTPTSGTCTGTGFAVTVTVNPTPTANAGGAMAAICQGGTSAALSGSFGGGATSAVWSDGAGGTFTNNTGTTPNTATYTAAANSASPITLTLTTSGGSCGTASATKTIVVNPTPTVNAGGAMAAICQGGTSAALGGSFGGGATSAVWTDGAGGTFTNNTGATPNTATYTAAANSPSPITLTLTTSGGSCGTTNATKTIVVNPLPATGPVYRKPNN